MSDIPEPLVPPEVDLTDFAFMPLHVDRARDSETAALDDPEAFRAAFFSWCVSWHQVPASSLPDDDSTLCKTLGYGRDARALKTWVGLRAAGALRGWVKCSDGRLYHRVIAEVALEAWLEKLAQRLKSGAGNAKRWGVEFSPAEIERSIEDALCALKKLNPKSKALSKRKPSGTANGMPQGNAKAVPQGIPQGSLEECNGDPKGQGQGQGIYNRGGDAGATQAPKPDTKALMRVGGAVLEAIGIQPDDPRFSGNYGIVQSWLNAGCDPKLDIIPTVRAVMANRTGPPPSTLKFFSRAVLQAYADRTSTPEIPHAQQRNHHNGQRLRSGTEDEHIAAILASVAGELGTA